MMLSQTALLGFFLWSTGAQPLTNCVDCSSGPDYWCGGPSGVGNAQTCVSSSSFCDNSACVAARPSSCPTSGSTTCGTGATPTRTPTPPSGVSATQGLGVKDAQAVRPYFSPASIPDILFLLLFLPLILYSPILSFHLTLSPLVLAWVSHS